KPTRYKVDGAWRDFTKRREFYRNAAGDTITAEELLVSHRGPVLVQDGRFVSFRWTAHDPSREIDALIAATRATSVAEFQRAMTSFRTPSQNMLVVDRAGSIGIRSQGTYPVRGPGVNGGYLVDGRSAANDWTGTLPIERYPQAVDPAQGFLVSANQQPVDPAVVPTYLGSHWADPWRAVRLNELLRGDTAVTVETMRRWQTDPLSARARTLVPLLLAAAQDDPSIAPALALLRAWDFRYTLEAQAPVLFEQAARRVARAAWDELVPAGGSNAVGDPSGLALVALLRDSASAWWDDRRTDARETRRAIVVGAIKAAYDSLVTARGPAGPTWAWSKAGGINVNHLLRLPGFSRTALSVTSGNGTVAPASGARRSHGASWRMIVEYANGRRTALAIYPGGQSGNPASARYDDRLEKWRTGVLDTLVVPESLGSVRAERTIASLTLSPR
ncbi:MAG: penicillin acylase family protein, partial [Gemmatimonadaceae bacterium]|nr:penicillin acylase family protein [Gemmatimonadaceae bacterium]